MPPAPMPPRATVSGQVIDGRPVSRWPARWSRSAATTPASPATTPTSPTPSGRYTIRNVLVGTYPSVVVFGPGYEVITQTVTVEAGGTTADFEPRRDWAATIRRRHDRRLQRSGLTAPACGRTYAIDLSQGTGWGSTTGDDNGTPTNVMIPKFIVDQASGRRSTVSAFCGRPVEHLR